MVSLDVFRALNHGSDFQSSLGETLRIIRENMGINAVGIRLRERDDYPYFVFEGFHDKHILLENELCATDLEGQLMRDDVGNPVLDCMCGNILRGRFDPTKPFFTEGGSFWTNSTTELLASTTEEDRLIRTRNTCQGEGYESVALIPIRVARAGTAWGGTTGGGRPWRSWSSSGRPSGAHPYRLS
jgi:hypothetical protein